MSVIAARVYDDRISIAADSIIIKEDLKKTNFNKLRHIGDTICGGCGSAEELCLFFEFVSNHKLKSATVSNVISYMHEFSKYKESVCGCETIDNAYLIIQNNILFEIDGFFVQEVADYTAIGAGEAYALTALYCGQTAEEAVKITCKLCCHVSEPVINFTYSKGNV